MTQATRWFQYLFKTYTQKSCWRKKLSSTIHTLTADHLLRDIGDWISGDPVINIIYTYKCNLGFQGQNNFITTKPAFVVAQQNC